MATATIRVSNVKQKFNEQWVDYKPGDELFKGKYGASLKVGYKNGEEWENYYVNNEQLFSYFEKGATMTVEYEANKSGFNVVKGVAPEPSHGKQSSGRPHDGGKRDKSIELQVVFKGCCELCAALPTQVMPDPLVVAEWVTSVHALIFSEPNPGEAIAKAKETVQKTLDAVEVEDEPEPDPMF